MNCKFPELKDRIQSTFIDSLLIILLMFLFARILENFNEVSNWVRITMFIGLFFVYEPLSMTLGCTLGNYLKGIRVRKNTDPTARINILQAFARYPVKLILGWLSFITINSNPKRRAIHDLVSGSVMIKI